MRQRVTILLLLYLAPLPAGCVQRNQPLDGVMADLTLDSAAADQGAEGPLPDSTKPETTPPDVDLTISCKLPYKVVPLIKGKVTSQ